VEESPFGDSLDRRPLLVAVAGPNGAGKSTFHQAFLSQTGLRFVNADVIAHQLRMDPYAAAGVANAVRVELVRERESFIFETVFSDPANEKISFLKNAAADGYTVVLCFIGLPNAAASAERVALRVSKGGHDVPLQKIEARYARSLANLASSIRELPIVLVFDNGNLRTPYRMVAEFRSGELKFRAGRVPVWLPAL